MQGMFDAVGGGGKASNQFFANLPNLPGTGKQVTKPAAGGNGYFVPGAGQVGQPLSPQSSPYNPYTLDVGGGYRSGSTLSPNFTSDFLNYLTNMMGKGAQPFNLRTAEPGGGTTTPGQLNAMLDPVLQQLQSFFKSGGTHGGFPGMTEMSDIAKNGIDASKSWQPMVDAMQRQIAQGRADLTESFNVGGGLVGSPYGGAMADYNMQSNKDLMSILSGMQFQGIQEQIGAQESLMGAGTDFGKFMQGLDQQSIQNMYQEFIRTRPEYSPLLPQEGQLSTTFPSYMGNKTSTNPLAGLIPGAAAGIGGGLAASLGGATAGASSMTGLLAMLAAL